MTDIRLEVTKNRDRLLAAALTIWRWGRQRKIFQLVGRWGASSNGVGGYAIRCSRLAAKIRANG